MHQHAFIASETTCVRQPGINLLAQKTNSEFKPIVFDRLLE